MSVEDDIKGFDPSIPRTAHPGVAARMYGELIPDGSKVLNVGAGDTDLEGGLQGLGVKADVTSLDPQYGRYNAKQEEGPKHIRGVAQELPFPDESFDITMAQFLLQHLDPDVASRAMREMLRVTRTAESTSERSGLILINPVFRPQSLRELIARRGFGDLASVWDHDAKAFDLAQRRDVYPTLVIHKTELITDELAESLIKAVEESGALRRRRTVSERIVRKLGGFSSK